MASRRFKSFVKQNWQMVSVLVIASVAALWFMASIVLDVVYFNDPRHQDEPIRGWMTPRYVGMSFDLPREVVVDLFKLPKDGPKGRRMHEIANELGVTLPELTDMVRDAAYAHREGQK